NDQIHNEMLGHYAYKAVQKHFQKSTQYTTKILQDVDPEPLHQMRVGLRRLRTAIQVFDPALSLPKTFKHIRKIARCLGDVRDLDVLLNKLETRYLPALDDEERDTLKFAVKRLQRQRRRKFGRVEKMLGGSNYSQFRQRFKTWLQAPVYDAIAPMSIQVVLPDLLLLLVSHLLLHPGWAVGHEASPFATDGFETDDSSDGSADESSDHNTDHSLDHSPDQSTDHTTDETIESTGSDRSAAMTDDAINAWLDQHGTVLHDLRKHIKRVRYQAEFFTEFYDSPYQHWVDELSTLQDLLGHLQDCWVLDQVFKAEIGKNWHTQMPTLAQQLRQERAATWKQWKPIQQKYLDPEFRDRLRRLVMTPVKTANDSSTNNPDDLDDSDESDDGKTSSTSRKTQATSKKQAASKRTKPS
ncbi:MAG: CHAD domain-containing protein, partial [Elainellaceae cyanobacterium]